MFANQQEEKTKNYLLNQIDDSWKIAFKIFGWEKIFLILESIEKDHFFPAKEDVFRLFRELSLENIKVVVLGQDPYYQEGFADGFAFSTRQKIIPASLNNIFLELEKDLKARPTKNSLENWVKQGVFLLNTCLTVKEKCPLSHKEQWEKFSIFLISYINIKRKNLIWIFWGKNAKSFKEKCGIDSKFIISSSHPSPFSANYGFFNSKPFSRANYFLKQKGELEILWDS